MNMKMILKLVSPVAVIGLLAFAGWQSPARGGTITYDVTVNSEGLAGTTGYLEFVMSAATYPSSASVTATISDVVLNGGSLGAESPPIGDVTGSLSSPPLVMDNATFSDFQQAYTYGTTLTYQLTFSGSDVGNPGATSGTTFAILLEDGTGMPLNTGPAGEAADVFFPPFLGAQYTLYGPSTGSYPYLTLSAVVPEPSGLTLMVLGSVAVAAVAHPRRKRTAA
jgi:hypothetical protein